MGRENNRFHVNANIVKRICKFCGGESSASNIKRHELSCYLNPINLKFCPVCKSPIKHYKDNTTCSYGCSNTLFRSGTNNPNWKETTYHTTCFLYHPHKCVVCDETNIVAAHHFDGNRDNNSPFNLVPLCPTHHCYFHSKFKHLVYDKIVEYMEKFRAAGNDPAASRSQSVRSTS